MRSPVLDPTSGPSPACLSPFACRRWASVERAQTRRTLRRSNVLIGSPICRTLCNMKTSTITIRLDPKLEELLDRICLETGRSRSEVARDALRRQLTIQLFEEARRKLIPFAEAQGIYTDEDVFKIVS